MSNVFQTCLKCFKLKKLVVKPKTAQPVDRQLNRSRGAKNFLSLPEWLFNRMRNRSTPKSIGPGAGQPPVQSIKGVNSNWSTPSSTSRGVQKTFSLFQNGCSTG